MTSIFSTVAYIIESNTVTTLNSSDVSTITRGVIACNRPQDNHPIFVNFVSFNQLIDTNQVYFLNGKFVYNVNKSNYSLQKLQFNIISAYQIKINVDNTPEQEIFMSFQCSVLSIPVIEGGNILFKSQAVEYNGKSRTEIPITCLCSVHNLRLFNKVNKLQKGNKINVTGNLIKNDEEVTISITYIVYSNSTSSSFVDKKDQSKIPWLDSSGHKKTINGDQFQNLNYDLPKFVNQRATDDIVEVINDVSDKDNNDNMKELQIKKPIKRKYNRKPKNSMSDKDQPSKRTRSRISYLAT